MSYLGRYLFAFSLSADQCTFLLSGYCWIFLFLFCKFIAFIMASFVECEDDLPSATEQELLELRTDDIEDYLSVSQQLALEDEQVIRDAETDVANYFQDQVGGAFQAADHVHVERVAGSFSRTFQLFFNRYKVTVNELEDMQPGDTILTIDLILEHILDEVLRDVGESDRVRLRLESRGLDRPIYTSITQKNQLTVYRWMADVARVLNSHEGFALDESFYVMVEYCKVPGGGCLDELPDLLTSTLVRKRSVVFIRNKDALCLARSLVVAKSKADSPAAFQAVRRSHSAEQSRQARSLQAAAGIPDRICTLQDIPDFERVSVT